MLRRSFDFVFSAPWQIFVPGGAIMVAVLGFNLVGDGLRDALGRERVRLRATPADDTPRFEAQRSESEDSEGGSAAALRVRGLTVDLGTPTGWLRVVDGVDLTVDAGEIVALVGESGCGKTVTALSIMGVLPPGASRSGGSVMVQDHELLGLVPRQLRKVQGREIAMVFQEPGSSLNPAFTVGDQIAEVIRHHLEMSRSEATARVVELLDRVGIPDPAARARSYPHELSGGMQQRAMLAMALACGPRVLLADEPTTALDVTVQAQILDLLAELARDEKLGVLLVTHDLGVVAEVADRVAVMYAGQVVETAPADALFTRPRHPYSEALLASRPQSVAPGDPLPVILGDVPRPGAMPPGCRFHPRCPYAIESCGAERPQVIELGPSRTACLRAHDLQLRGLQ